MKILFDKEKSITIGMKYLESMEEAMAGVWKYHLHYCQKMWV